MPLTKKQKYDRKYYMEHKAEIAARRRKQLREKLTSWFTKTPKVKTGKLGRKK